MLRSEKGIGKHKFEGTENDEGQSGTICNTNNGKASATSGSSSQINCSNTTNDISLGEIVEGAEPRDPTNDIAIRETIAGAKLGS